MLNKITYIDIETSGLSRFYDQPLSAFGKTIDSEGGICNLFDESCSMTQHRLPSPEALLTNGLSFDSLVQNQSLCSFLHKLYRFISENGSQLLIAHNSNFDYSMISNSFFQNLISGDLYQWKGHGNRLMDSQALARSLHAFEPDSKFEIPLSEKGFPLFDLSSLCKANGIEIKEAHTSSGDVLMLEQLVNLMREASPDLFNLCFRCSNRKDALEIISGEPFICVPLGTYSNFSTRVLVPVAVSQSGADVICFDLLSDIDVIENFSAIDLSKYLGSRINKSQPVVKLALNKGVVIGGPDQFNKNPDALKIGPKELFRRASQLRRNTDLRTLASQSFAWKTEDDEEIELETEETIYALGFPSEREKSFIAAFNLSSPDDRLDVVKGYTGKLKSDRFTRLAHRVLLEEYPTFCSSDEREGYFNWCHERLFRRPSNDYKPRWNTLYSCMSELEKLKGKYPNKIERIEELDVFYKRVASFAGVDIPLINGQ